MRLKRVNLFGWRGDVLVAAMGLILASCANQPMPPGTMTHVKTVGVISCLGDTFTYQSFGSVIFGDETTTTNIADWNLDAIVVKAIKARLEPEHSVVTIPFDRTVFETQPHAWENPDHVTVRELKEVLKTAPDVAKSVDLWIVVREEWMSGTLAPSRRFQGVDVQNAWDVVFHGRHATAYIAAWMSVFDARTLELVGKNLLVMRSGHIGGGTQLAQSQIRNWPDIARWDQLSRDQQQQLHDAVVDALNKSLAYTLTDLNLGN